MLGAFREEGKPGEGLVDSGLDRLTWLPLTPSDP